jgi:hypothetical protein
MLDAARSPQARHAKHIIGDPITVSWRPTRIPRPSGQPAGALPLSAAHVAISKQRICRRRSAGCSSRAATSPGQPPGWRARCSTLNAVWGVVDFLGGATGNRGQRLYGEIQPLALPVSLRPVRATYLQETPRELMASALRLRRLRSGTGYMDSQRPRRIP